MQQEFTIWWLAMQNAFVFIIVKSFSWWKKIGSHV